MQKFNYVFSEIPNNEEGQELVRLMRKYLNKDAYNMQVKGQPISLSKNLRVYIERKRNEIKWSNIG